MAVWDVKLFTVLAGLARKIGLTCGIDFKSFVDPPHFELGKYVKNKSVDWLLDTYGTPERFQASWGKDKKQIEPSGKTVQVLIDGSPYKALLSNGVTYVPVRIFGEATGDNVSWNAVDKKAVVNGVELDGILIEGKAYAPVRMFAEVVGYAVDYDENTKKASIVTGKQIGRAHV